MTTPKLNVKLLRKIQSHILEEPRRLHMAGWGSKSEPESKNDPPCGTTGCIAGWALWLTGVTNLDDVYDVSTEAASRLGLTKSPGLMLTKEQYALFYVEHWPTKYLAAYGKAKTRKGRAKATSERIQHFIEHRE